MFPWKDGVAAIVSLDGAEKNTIQFAPDGINFRSGVINTNPTCAPGVFCSDAFADNLNGRGISWDYVISWIKKAGQIIAF